MSEELPSKSEALQQLEEQAALLAQQQAIAESEKAIAEAIEGKLAAELPAGDILTLPEGSITSDTKFGYLAELVTYDTLARQAKNLATHLNNMEKEKLPDGSKILLVSDLDVAADDMFLRLVEQQIKDLTEALKAQNASNKDLLEKLQLELKSPLPKMDAGHRMLIPGLAVLKPALAVTTATIGAVANIAQMFRAGYTATGKEITLSTTALHALVAGKISKFRKWEIYLPHFGFVRKSKLLDKWSELVQQRWSLNNQVQHLRQEIIAPLSKQSKALNAELANLPDSEKKKKQQEIANLEKAQALAEIAKEQSEALITAFDEISKTLLAIPEGQTASPLAAAILRERIESLEITHLLYATIVSSGGEVIIKKGWFICSGHTEYLGGSVVSYLLADQDGRIVAADTLVDFGRLEYKLGSENIPDFEGNRTHP
jgi:hypothetical protein